MPIETPSGDADQKFLAEGMAEELIFELGRFRKLFVSSRTATRALEGTDTDPQSVGEHLGVRYVLTGSIRQLGSRVRLLLTLIETETGTVVWNDRLSQSFDELVGGLDDLASRIASTVLGRIEESDIAAARRVKPESMTAYECHLRGLEFHRLGGITDDNLRLATEWFKRAVEVDPNFARPHAMLTCAWSELPDFDLDVGIRNVERALELDPNDPEANRVMGSAKSHLYEFESSQFYHEKALALSPSDAYIKSRCAAFYIFIGEPELALALLDQAEELDPFLPVWCIVERVAAFYAMDCFRDALEAGRALPFQTRRSRLYRAASRVALGEQDRAENLVAEALAAAPNLTTQYFKDFEFYRDRGIIKLLFDRLIKAGLPYFQVATKASRRLVTHISNPGD